MPRGPQGSEEDLRLSHTALTCGVTSPGSHSHPMSPPLPPCGDSELPHPRDAAEPALTPGLRGEVPCPPTSYSPAQESRHPLPLTSARLTHTPTPAASGLSHSLPRSRLAALPWPGRLHAPPSSPCGPQAGRGPRGLSRGPGCWPRGGSDPGPGRPCPRPRKPHRPL